MSLSTRELPALQHHTAVETLAAHYQDRLAAAREARNHDVGVVGRIGNTVPTELVLACGWVPVLVAAEMGTPTPTADLYMEPVIAPETRSLFELGVNGSYQDFELLILSRPYTHLYYYLKEVFRQGKARRLPRLWMYDLMQSQRDAVRAYNWHRTVALRERLEALAGVELTDARLRAAIWLSDRVRALQRDLLERRWRGELAGVDALRAIGAGYFMPPDEYAQALTQYLAELSPNAGLQGRPRLLVVPSEPLSYVHLHQALEDAGGLVIAEDDWWGSRAPGADVPRTGSALEGIFLKYWSDTATRTGLPRRGPRSLVHGARCSSGCRRRRLLPATLGPPVRVGLPTPARMAQSAG